jgi:hypothetical protein
MSKTDEDNYILDEGELFFIENMLGFALSNSNNDDEDSKMAIIVSEKITKLNDLVKYMQKRNILIYDGDKAHEQIK